jgi:hypothetical protein
MAGSPEWLSQGEAVFAPVTPKAFVKIEVQVADHVNVKVIDPLLDHADEYQSSMSCCVSVRELPLFVHVRCVARLSVTLETVHVPVVK